MPFLEVLYELYSSMSQHSETPSSHCFKRRMHLLPELVDNITDHLFDDIPTLRSCSLVNHAWHYSTQRYLFRNIFIEEQKEESSRIPEFAHYLKSSLWFCTWAVRKVHLQGLTIPFPPTLSLKSRLHDTHVLEVLRCLPSLQTLILQCIYFSSTSRPLTGTIPPEAAKLPSLQKLVVADIIMQRDHLFYILSYIKVVREVHLLGVNVYSCHKLNFDAVGVLEDFGDSPDLNISAIPFALPSLGIQSLTIEGVRSENCLTGNAFFKLLPSIKDSLISLDIDVKDIVGHYYADISREVNALGSLLSQVGPQLHHLRVDLSSEPNLYTNGDLGSCHSLRACVATFFTARLSDPITYICRWQCNLGSCQSLVLFFSPHIMDFLRQLHVSDFR